MITLLAESKTMSGDQLPVTELNFQNHKPVLEDMADNLMEDMAHMNPLEISSTLGISLQLAKKANSLAYDFPHKLTGYKAINGYVGDAYRGLDIKTISDNGLEAIYNNLIIISSVYGILRGDDIIKPYRCEFNKEIAPGRKTPIQFFKSKVTIEMVKLVRDGKIGDVIDLLPADADKCVDWKIVRAYTKVHKVCFQIITSEGKLKTPIAKRLKELRGIMCRTIAEKGIKTFQALTKVESPHFIFSPQDSKPGLPVFITTE